MKVTAIIQARMGSTRLPGKVLKEVKNKALLEYQLERVRQSLLIDDIVIATTQSEKDTLIVEFCNDRRIHVFKGAEDNVLERYYQAAKKHDADVIVRLTSDCPLIDPELIDEVIRLYLKSEDNIDYASNTLARSYPRGLDIEVFSFEALEISYQQAVLEIEREHVTPYIYNNPEKFKLVNLNSLEDFSYHRWTVDTAEDFELVKRIIEATYPNTKDVKWKDIIGLLKENPSWVTINKHIEQKKI